MEKEQAHFGSFKPYFSKGIMYQARKKPVKSISLGFRALDTKYSLHYIHRRVFVQNAFPFIGIQWDSRKKNYYNLP